MVNTEFAKWASGFSGCDGGNPTGSVWLCGLEFGGSNPSEDMAFDNVEVPPFVGEPHYDRNEFLKYQYNWKGIKLLAALAGHDPANYAAFFKDQSCFDRNSQYFKLNLYPFAFQDTSHKHWADWLYRKTGFKTKQEYLTWCSENRFRSLRDWVTTYSPSLIICTGKSYITDFRAAFGEGSEEVITTEGAGRPIQHFLTNAGKTLVAVIYFLGGVYGLKSDPDLADTGKKLAELLKRGS